MEKYVLQISRKEATVCGQFIAFHTDYSNGTVAVRGDRQLDADSIAYWEINVPHRLFGTSVMFGVGSKLAKVVAQCVLNFDLLLTMATVIAFLLEQ